MKRISFSRKAILHAIRAACIALFLLAAQREATAQSLTAPFAVNGSAVSTNANGTFTSPVGFYDITHTYSTFSVGSGVTINSTSGYGEDLNDFFNTKTIIEATTGTFTNAGSINLSTSNSDYNAAVFLNQGTTSVNASNSGTITSGGINLNVYTALEITSTSGNVTFANTGTISTAGGNDGTALQVQTVSGNIQVTNEQSGQLSSGNGYGLVAETTGTGSVTTTNDGIISVPLEAIVTQATSGSTLVTNNGTLNFGTTGINSTSSSGGTINVVNKGSLVGSNSGIYAGGAGNISVTNMGTISGCYYALNVHPSNGSAATTLTNTGNITGSGSGIYAYYTAANAASSFQITNSGSITASHYGMHLYSVATVYNTGSIDAPVAISVPSGSFVTLAGISAITGTIIGGADSTSTSQLTFALAIPAADLAEAKAQLNAEITAYDTQMGGNMTFTINGVSYDISNFDYTNIADDLTVAAAARLYRSTPGFYSEGTVLDHLNTNNAQASKLLTALGNVSDPGLVNALSELSPKTLEIFSNVANNGATFNAAKINNHLANRRDGLTGFDATALNVQDSSMDPTLNQVRDHLLAYNPVATPGLLSDSVESVLGGTDMKSAQVNTLPPDRWSTFIAGDVILADLSHNNNLQDANYTTGDVTAGADYRLDDHFTVGALFAYSHTDASLDGRGGSATVDSYSPGIYASYVDKGWYGNGLATYGRNAYTSDRVIDIPGLQGDNHGGTSGNQGTLNLTGGYEFQKGAFKFGPVASVQYVHLSVDSMQEQGPTALSIDSQDQDSFRSQLGVEGRFVANVTTPIGPVSLTPHVSLSWQHEYLDDSRGINAQFTGTGGGSFATQTDSPDRDAAFIDVGLDTNIGANVTVFVDYETQAGQQNFFAQSAQGGVKIGF